MSNSVKSITLIEHSSLFVSPSGKVVKEGEDVGVPKRVFDEVKSFVLQNKDDVHQFLVPGYKKHLKETLKAQQYVGVIETRSGYSIEILPKLAKGQSDNDIQSTRKTFMKMLRELRNSPFKHFNSASLETTRMHLLDIYITMFLDELAKLIRRGIKSDYIKKEENSTFLKGRLKIAEHLRNNVINKERFYVEFDEYQQNRIENRIIRTTLEFLYKKAHQGQHKKRIREFLFVFDNIKPLNEVKSVFSKVVIDRQMKDYEIVLIWCRLFLNNESFTAFRGNTVAFALLFNMNRVFEDYVAHCLRRDFPNKEIQIQVRGEYLLTYPKDEFLLKPDLQIGETIIADTKWKMLSSEKPHFGISQADIYQMFAYGKKYEGTKHIVLLYPMSDTFRKIRKYKFDKELSLRVVPFNCEVGKIYGYKSVTG